MRTSDAPHPTGRPFLTALGVAALAVAGCSGSSSARRTTSAPSGSVSASALTVTSPQFATDTAVPSDYTCKGAGRVPTLAWTGDLRSAKAIAVVVDDPDAPNGTYTHLVVLDLPAGTTRLPAPLPAGTTQGLNSDGATGWTPPCPPSGTHHYRFTVYGLSRPTGLSDGATIESARKAIAATTVARGTLVGLVSA